MTSGDYDVIIVGAGSAGCVLAERLSADPALRVLLVEAGPRDRSPLIRVPKGFGLLLGSERYAWHYPTPTGGPGEVVEYWVRGKTLGGSSSVNGMIYNRGSAADYADLAAAAGAQWSWDTVKSAFLDIENHALGGSDHRGVGGPLHVSTSRDLPELCDATMSAAATAGLRRTADVNDGGNARIGPSATTIHNGRRVSAARAFLRPARHRANLTVVTETAVDRLLFEGDNVVGLLVRQGDTTSEIRARRQVILSARSLATPKILERSGIGDPEVLKPLGIDVRVDRPRVGAGLREHRCVALQFRLRTDEGYNRLLSTPRAQAITAARYLATKRGPMAGAAYDVVGFLNTAGSTDRPDAQILMAPFSALPYTPGERLGVERAPGMQVIGYALRPTSEGSVHITSGDPDAPLDVRAGYLQSAHDRDITVALLRWIRELATLEPLAGHVLVETRPGPNMQTDEEIIGATLDDGYSGYHAIGTAAMGQTEECVVDGDLRVRGVGGLSALDASVLPTMVSGNLNGPIMALAWSAAPMLADRSLIARR